MSWVLPMPPKIFAGEAIAEMRSAVLRPSQKSTGPFVSHFSTAW